MPKTQMPVSVLCGFLGSGKTTVLNWILKDSASIRYAVLVNDLGEVNIDSSLIKNAVKNMDGAIAGMLELQGGCICCSIQTDLLDALLELSEQFQPDHIIIEASGVADPKAILNSIYSENFYGRKGTDFLEVANTVTVVDGGNMEHYLESPENTGGSRRNYMLQCDPRRPLQELLIEQIECADILLINKVDTFSDDDLHRFRNYLETLNYTAEIWESSFGKIDTARLMNERRFGEEKTIGGSAWYHAIIDNEKGRSTPPWKLLEERKISLTKNSPDVTKLQEDKSKIPSWGLIEKIDRKHTTPSGEHSAKDHHHNEYGLEAFIYNARKPFVEFRFLELVRSGLPGVFRAKGFYWTKEVPDKYGVLSIAGKMMRADYLSNWWYTLVQNDEVKLKDIQEHVATTWLPVFGDRRQELVFIGIDIDREKIESALNSCLVDDD